MIWIGSMIPIGISMYSYIDRLYQNNTFTAKAVPTVPNLTFIDMANTGYSSLNITGYFVYIYWDDQIPLWFLKSFNSSCDYKILRSDIQINIVDGTTLFSQGGFLYIFGHITDAHLQKNFDYYVTIISLVVLIGFLLFAVLTGPLIKRFRRWCYECL